MTSIRSPGPLALILFLGLVLGSALPAAAEDTPGSEPAAPAAEEPATEEPEQVEIPWVLDYAKAKAKAKAEGKDLFVNFTGSDWCGWCHRLEDEVFAHKAFVDEATKQYVLVYLDFPQAEERKAKVVDPALNDRLRDEFGVGGYPTIALVKSDGRPYGKIGYQEGGPQPYLESLASLREEGDALLALDTAGKENTSTPQLQKGLDLLVQHDLFAYPGYRWIVDHVKQVDADGTLGMKIHIERYEEGQKFQKLITVEDEEEPDWEGIADFLMKSKHLGGPTYVNVGITVADKLRTEKNKPGAAKALAEKIGRDPIFEGNERAAKLLAEFLAKCERALNPPAEDEAGEQDAEGKDKDAGGEK